MSGTGGGDRSDYDSLLRAVARAPGDPPAVDPARLAHFRILGRLGQGGMGVVYRAEDEKLHRNVALKILPPSFAADDERRARFLREARSAAAITHPNVASVYEIGEDGDVAFIAMELVEGETLGRRLARGPLPVREALAIARAILKGVERAHAKGVVHRDLKPDNVMIDHDGNVKILDFGLAKLREVESAADEPIALAETAPQLTHDGKIVGTPEYMSPEQASGEAVDARADLFSFGVVLFEMVTGARPFRGKTSRRTIVSVLRDAPPPVRSLAPHVAPALESVIARCLAKSAAERFESARAVLEAIDAAAPSDGDRSTPGAARTGRRVLWPLVAIAIAIAVLVPVVRGRDARSPALAASSSAPSASASGVPTAITALPPPKTNHPEAAAAYAAAMQSFRDASIAVANASLARAVELDPSFAAAHVQRAKFLDIESLRKAVEAATQHRSALSPRDSDLLDVYRAASLRDAPDPKAELPAWRALAERYPGDAEIMVLAASEHIGIDDDRALAMLDRAAALDPQFAWPFQVRALLFEGRGEFDKSLEASAQCLARSPSAPTCLRARTNILARRGDCAQVEADSRTMVALEPSSPLGYLSLTNALLSRDAPIDAIEQAMTNAVERFQPGWEKTYRAWHLAGLRYFLAGDFAYILSTLLPRWEEERKTATSEQWANVLAWTEIYVFDESGRVDRIGPLVDDQARREPRVVQDGGDIQRAAILDARRRVKHGGDRELAAARDAAKASRDPWKWLSYYAMFAHTPEEAREALSVFPGFDPLRAIDGDILAQALLGHVKLLAGDVDGAIAHLTDSVRACFGIDASLLFRIRAAEELGEALEAKGDTAGACAAYAFVLKRWGNAKPRSVTVDRARPRAKKLGCAISSASGR